jgi:predicted nucleic acid-binding protein
MIFVDTSAWFAAYVPNDPQHAQVKHVLSSAPRLVTTDYILDETITLMKVLGHVDRAYHFGPHSTQRCRKRLDSIRPIS